MASLEPWGLEEVNSQSTRPVDIRKDNPDEDHRVLREDYICCTSGSRCLGLENTGKGERKAGSGKHAQDP